MNASRSYGNAPKSKARKSKQNHWIRFEEVAKRYIPLLPSSVWTTYTTLFTFRNRKTNQCFPRYQTIADSRGLHRRTIMRHVDILINFGLIEKETIQELWMAVNTPGILNQRIHFDIDKSILLSEYGRGPRLYRRG